jgi:hypothetical protein
VSEVAQQLFLTLEKKIYQGYLKKSYQAFNRLLSFL